jgi:hypothetical protein
MILKGQRVAIIGGTSGTSREMLDRRPMTR